jgi:cell fate regulator YaaT (PSP1 superfamily)
LNYVVKLKVVSRPVESNFTLKKDEIVLCKFGDEIYRAQVQEEIKKSEPEGKVLRPVFEKEMDKVKKLEEEENECAKFFEERVKLRGLDMKLIGVEKEWEGSKIKFYFIADQRVDFRELVKDLARKYRVRIELRQIGVRDLASYLGGMGPCGRPLCCATFLDNKVSVKLETAREQNIVIDASRISGVCGRLFCCLVYEQDFYKEMGEMLPKIGSVVETEKGKAEVIYTNFILQYVRVKYKDGSEETLGIDKIKYKKHWWLFQRKK